MKKVLLVVVVSVILLLGIFVAAQESGADSGISTEVSQVVDEIAPGAGDQVAGFIQDFVSNRGIEPGSIDDISQVDFNALPKEVNIENVGDHNLAIYKVDYTNESGKQNQVYVVSYSVEKLKAQGDIILAQDKREFLDFGKSGTMESSGFLETSTGVTTGIDRGYVMVRDGSITAISTNLEVFKNNQGSVEIIIYRNGEQVSFGNTLDTELLGVKKDYDVQSKGTVTFKAGDVISAYAKINGEVDTGNIITMVEITSTN